MSSCGDKLMGTEEGCKCTRPKGHEGPHECGGACPRTWPQDLHPVARAHGVTTSRRGGMYAVTIYFGCEEHADAAHEFVNQCCSDSGRRRSFEFRKGDG